jgi:pyruvate/2-oxoglutarate dehydrogenase complex dihydrolipoamide acyltransferase (E2) component
VRTGLVDVTMPQMGVSVAEGTLVAWRVAVGDSVAADQTVCEISTDKIDTEVPAPVAGVVTELLVEVEETVAVGTVLARLSVEGAAPAPGAAPGGAPAPGAAPVAAAAPSNGRAAPAGGAAAPAAPAASEPQARRGRYSPVVQRIAAQHGIDLGTVVGTGRDGRVRKQDVLAVVEAAAEPPMHIESPYRPDPVPAPVTVPAPASPQGPEGPPGPTRGGNQLSRMRRTIGEHMKRSLDTAATCTTWIEVDMSRVEAERARLRVTALAFVARACVGALREHPSLNAWLEDGGAYTRFDREVHLGIAVSLGEDGLIVPVVRDAHELSVEGLAARIRDLAGRARSGGLTPDEVRGATFTITNPGQYGSIMATPIINLPQVGILDLEAIVKRPVVVTDAEGNDAIAIRPMTILGLSWDHRALDGALAAKFLASVKRGLQEGSLA